MAVASSDTSVERFGGFPDAAIQFFFELQAEQSRAWFAAHRDDYVRLCRRPLELLMAGLHERLLDVYPGLSEVEPHIFRIQRDTRFARDKTPYKTNVAAALPVRAAAPGASPDATPSLYVSFGLDGELVGVGCWHLPPELLAAYRAAVDEPRSGPRLQRLVDQLRGQGWTLESMETLKRVPPPYPQDHARGELLKRKGLAATIRPAEGISAEASFEEWTADRLREAAPLVKWLEAALGRAVR
jgi:uncharacterized protein (TIGR02453 family)